MLSGQVQARIPLGVRDDSWGVTPMGQIIFAPFSGNSGTPWTLPPLDPLEISEGFAHAAGPFGCGSLRGCDWVKYHLVPYMYQT